LKPCLYRPDRTFSRHLSRLSHTLNDPDLDLDVLGIDEDGGAQAHASSHLSRPQNEVRSV
jgi:hypothetical protein